MPKPYHHALRIEAKGLLRQLVSPVTISAASPGGQGGSPGKVYNLLWDTGATGSVIIPRVAKELGLIPIGKKQVGAAGAMHDARTFMVDFVLPMGVLIHTIEVCELQIAGIDGLIGMDVISTGDFSISNYDGKTVFSFAFPPFQNRADHLEKANSINRRHA